MSLAVHGCDIIIVQGGPSDQIAGLGWADIDLSYSTICLVLLGLLVNWAELPEQVGKMVEHLISESTQPNYPTRWTTLY